MGSADIAATLRNDIIMGVLQLHTPLPPERQLAETWGVSRGTIRKALEQLERENLVETRHGSGTYVVHAHTMPTGDLIESVRPLELIDSRIALEPHICRLAVLHGRRRDFDKLEELLQAMENSVEDPDAFADADSLFHACLSEATHNSLLIWIIAQVNLVRGRDEWTRMRHVTLEPGIIKDYNIQHRKIVNAILARDAELAATLMRRHLETARLSLTRSIAT